MAFLLRKLFHFRQIADQDILFVFLWFLPFLTAQNLYDNSVNSHCVESITKCLYKDVGNTGNEEPFYLRQMKTILHEHEKKLCHKLKAIYGNITEHMEDLRQPQVTKLNELAEAVEAIKDKLEDLVDLQEVTRSNTLAQQQEDQCKKVLEDAVHYMNGLRNLVLERYTEADMMNAIRGNDIKKLKVLVDAGIKVDFHDNDFNNNTPLHTAGMIGNLQMIRYLVKKGAPLEARNRGNNTPLIDAAGKNQLQAVKLLIKLGANPLARGWAGETPRISAVRHGNKAVANWLKDNGW